MIERRCKISNNQSVCYIRFNNITDLVEYIDNTEPTKNFLYHQVSKLKEKENFYGTSSFEEARNMLLNGYEEGAKLLNASIKQKMFHVKHKMKTICYNDVTGYQPNIPLYLSGIPQHMINTKTIITPQKNVNYLRLLQVSYDIKTSEILDKNANFFEHVIALEQDKKRVGVDVGICVVDDAKKVFIASVPVKKQSQKLNIKQLSFPVLHPSMLRRIFCAVIERSDFCNTKKFQKNYGLIPTSEMIQEIFNETKIFDVNNIII